jgi:hypothetical protein
MKLVALVLQVHARDFGPFDRTESVNICSQHGLCLKPGLGGCSCLDPNIHGTLKPRRGTLRHRHPTLTFIQKRLTAIADKYSLDMQNVRYELILELKALAEMAQQKAIDTHPAKDEVKQGWSRLAAYISQVINGLCKTYEEVKTDEDLKKLQDLIEEVKQKQLEEPQTPQSQNQYFDFNPPSTED